MSTLRKLSVAVIATTAVLTGVNSANAFTITTGGTSTPTNGIFSSVVGATTANFDTTFGAPLATYSGGALITGSVIDDHVTPFGDTSQYLTVAPTGSGAVGSTGSVTIALASLQNYFGLYWGSVDPFNQVEFYNGSTLIKTVTGGSEIGSTATSSHTSPLDNLYVNFFAGAGEEFNKVVLKTTDIAFESDNHAFAKVPEPASILGLLAFGVLGAGSLVKRTLKTV